MELESAMGDGYVATKLEAIINWCRKNSLYPMPMGISCCAIEMMAAAGPRFDIARFGSEVMRFTPRQCDVMIVAGTTTYKMSKVVRKIYDQMPEPKWVIAMGACTSSGGITARILSCRASTSFFRWMCMWQGVLRVRIIY